MKHVAASIVWLCPVVACSVMVRAADLSAADERPVVYLAESRSFEVTWAGQPFRGDLAREIVRQALLIAARDELGAVTRDALLGEAAPGTDSPLSFEVAAAPGEPSRVKILRGPPASQGEVWRREITFEGETFDYLKLAAEMEQLSRTELVEVLKKAGLAAKPREPFVVTVPEAIEKQLGEMTCVAQFTAVRRLHEQLHHGESPALLGALVRGYANLGVLTDFYWRPLHKVFQARSLLYAERLMDRDGGSTFARAHRGYALALIGLPKAALDDVAELSKSVDPKVSASQPLPWVDLITAYCRFDMAALEPAKHPSVPALAKVLQYLALEQSGSNKQIIEAAYLLLADMPECYRVQDSLAEAGGAMQAMLLSSTGTVPQQLYERLKAMTDLPPSARAVVKRRTTSGGLIETVFGAEDVADPRGEIRDRAQLMQAFRESAGSDAVKPEAGRTAEPSKDPGEFSYAILGRILEELSFVHVWRHVNFERDQLGNSADEWLTATAPLIADHPYRAFIASYAWEGAKRKKALEEMRAAIKSAPLTWRAKPVVDALWGFDNPLRMELLNRMLLSADATQWDLAQDLAWGSADTKAKTARTLSQVSPHSPRAMAALVEYDWPAVREQAAAWEKSAQANPRLLLAIGKRHFAEGQFEAAEGCVKAAIEKAPDVAAYRSLAEIYKQQNKAELWLSTLEKYLEQDAYGLEHAQVRSEIARHFIAQRDWLSAQTYAEGAAESGAAWAMSLAGDVAEALQDWERAEQWFSATAMRYRSSQCDWYFFCRRTGQGDLASAHELAQQYVREVQKDSCDFDAFEVSMCYMLDKQPQKAIELLERDFAASNNPYLGLHLALLHDELKHAEKRDMALAAIKTKGANYLRKATGKPRQELIALAAILAEDLAKGGKGHIDFSAADKLRSSGDDAEQMNFNYFLAKYLALRGLPAKAIETWKQCMASTQIHDHNRTLAGAELWNYGIAPSAYKDLLQGEMMENDQAEAGEAATRPGRAAIKISIGCDPRIRLAIVAASVLNP